MHDMPEIEYKTLLTQSEYSRLKDYYANFSTVIQKNTYFDTPTRQLSQRNISLRIRFLNDCYILTLKLPTQSHVREIELDVLSDHVSEIYSHQEIASLLKSVTSEEIHPLGTLTTFRTEISLENAQLCIDENHYLALIDYELEYELHQDINDDYLNYRQLLHNFGIREKKAKGKFFRFIQSLDNDI